MTERFARARRLRALLAVPLTVPVIVGTAARIAIPGALARGVPVALSLAAAPRVAQAGIFPFIPNHYTFSRDQVQGAVARKFPYQRSVSQLFALTLDNPVVGLRAQANRVVVTVDAHLSSPFLAQPVDSVLSLSSELAYDAPSRSVVLRNPNVERVDVSGDAAQYAQQINAAASVAVTQLLANYPIYTFKPEQLQFAGQQYEPGTITILSNGIRVQIVEK
jgi:Protein of unknown function (DUF1439)